jgi:hypothetical protein
MYIDRWGKVVKSEKGRKAEGFNQSALAQKGKTRHWQTLAAMEMISGPTEARESRG